MKTGFIYKITCITNLYFLFGSSTQKSKRRWYQYIDKLRKNSYKNDILQRCYNKYGENSLKFEIVQKDIPEDILEDVENIWIGANCSKSSDGKGGMNIRNGNRNSNICIETRKKISLGNKGKKISEEVKNKIRIAHIGKKHTEETKKRLSDIKKGKHISEEHRNKITKFIEIIIFDLEGNLLKIVNTLKEASIFSGASKENIYVALKKENKGSANKFIFVKKENFDPSKCYKLQRKKRTIWKRRCKNGEYKII